MGSKRNGWFISLAGLAIMLLSSSDALATPRGGGRGPARGFRFGPPAHAPAYGYRNKVVYGYSLIFDSACGLYIVVGLTDCYYHDGHFYRWRGGVWEISLRADKWDLVGLDKLPAPVHLKIKSVAKYHSPGNSAAKPNGPGNSDIKPNSSDKPGNGSRDAKPGAGGPSDPKPNATAGNDAKANANGNGPVKPTGAAGGTKAGTGSDTKSNTNAGSSAKPGGAAPNASGSSPAKPASSGTNSAKPSGNSGGSKPRGSGKGKR